MPNIESHQSTKCGNDKCGTFAPVNLHPHHGGKPMPGSGGKVSGRSSGARNQVAKGRSNSHMHGGMPMHSMKHDSDGDYD